MNYRHQFHAGNFADVMKHVLLVRLVRSLQKKEKGFLYLDTHAGRGSYDLAAAATGDSQARKPEWPDGIGRLGRRAGQPPAVAEYVELADRFDRESGNLAPGRRFFPGSPELVRRLARPQDRLALYEKHPAECGALRTAVGWAARVAVYEIDGYEGPGAMLPPGERRALTLIDPPYESPEEFAHVVAAVREGLRRFATGIYAIWYPLTERARVDEFFTELQALRLPPTLVAELAIAGDAAPMKLKGCGLVVINPPWQFDGEAAEVLTYLGEALAQAPGGGGRVDWLVPEAE
jgi:23S rRNA (adenine2030-N6)-methyltransferase